MEAEVEASVHCLRVNTTGGHKHLQAKHFNMCLQKAYPEKDATPPPPKSVKWMKLVEMVQFMWNHGTIPAELGWMILILVPNSN